MLRIVNEIYIEVTAVHCEAAHNRPETGCKSRVNQTWRTFVMSDFITASGELTWIKIHGEGNAGNEGDYFIILKYGILCLSIHHHLIKCLRYSRIKNRKEINKIVFLRWSILEEDRRTMINMWFQQQLILWESSDLEFSFRWENTVLQEDTSSPWSPFHLLGLFIVNSEP